MLRSLSEVVCDPSTRVKLACGKSDAIFAPLNRLTRRKQIVYFMIVKRTKWCVKFFVACCSPGATSSTPAIVVFLFFFCKIKRLESHLYQAGVATVHLLDPWEVSAVARVPNGLLHSPLAMPTFSSPKNLLKRVNTIANKPFFICTVNSRRPSSIFLNFTNCGTFVEKRWRDG